MKQKIELLPEHIIDQIKAGEVLERPASLIKELIENSLDANATEIHIHLIENGMELISIEDNGDGMNYADLPFAFLRHATSKIKSFDDIYRLHSFGFRGEALASLAACARVTCSTQPKDLSEKGGKIIINGGLTELLIEQQSKTQGTSFYIRDLFFNTPARLKFIKSKVSEKSSLKKLINSFILSNPHVTFTVKWDEKEKEIYKAINSNQNILERINQVFFAKKSEQTHLFHQIQEYDGYEVEVIFSQNVYSTPQYRHHYLFVNNRFFSDKSLHSAMLRNLDKLWRNGESGHYVVKLKVPPSEIDVNVHPSKTQVKFLRSDIVFSILVSSIKNAIKDYLAQNANMLNPSENTQNSLIDHMGDNKAPSFFSEQEEKAFDLSYFQGQGSDEDHFKNLFLSDSTLERSVESNQHYTKLTDEFLIVHIPHLRLIHLKDLFVSDLLYEMKKFIQEQSPTNPLLISEPFKMLKGPIDSNLEKIKELGLEFDRLNNEFIVLRTIPHYIAQSMLTEFSKLVLDYFNLSKTIEFDEQKFKQFIDKSSEYNLLSQISSSGIDKLLAKSNLSDYSVELNNQKLQSLFNKR